MKCIQTNLIAAILLATASGCSSMNTGGSWDQQVHAHLRSQHAWNQWSWYYDELDYPYHFAKGFKAGYRDILNGGKGCQPTLPPKSYWKWNYRSAEGRRKVNAWFDAFSHGALAAQKDGAGSWSQIPLSPTDRMNLETAARNNQPVPDYSRPPAPVQVPAPPEIGLLLPDIDSSDGNVLSDADISEPPLPYDIETE